MLDAVENDGWRLETAAGGAEVMKELEVLSVGKLSLEGRHFGGYDGVAVVQEHELRRGVTVAGAQPFQPDLTVLKQPPTPLSIRLAPVCKKTCLEHGLQLLIMIQRRNIFS